MTGSSFADVLSFFPAAPAAALAKCGAAAGEIRELRLYAGKAVVLDAGGTLLFCRRDGALCAVPGAGLLTLSAAELFEVLERASAYALFSREAQTRQSFLTADGCRIGVSGLLPDGRLAPGGLRSLNIRLPFAGRLTGDNFTLAAVRRGESLLLAGRPAAGKTTLLKRFLFTLAAGQAGRYYRVCVVDSRGEFAGFAAGSPEILTADVIDFGEKSRSVETALRLFSPDWLLCDEIGSLREAGLLLEGANAGVTLLASIHARSPAELARRPQFRLLARYGAFASVAFLSDTRPGEVVRTLTVPEVLRAGEAAA